MSPYVSQNDVQSQAQGQVQVQIPTQGLTPSQGQGQVQVQGGLRNGTSSASATSIAANSLGLGVGVGTSSVGTVSRTGSLLEGSVASIGTHSENGGVSLDGSSSTTVDKDELFLYEGLRLDGDAPEFEPQATRGW